jgi:hypothetical protein
MRKISKLVLALAILTGSLLWGGSVRTASAAGWCSDYCLDPGCGCIIHCYGFQPDCYCNDYCTYE